jgi:cobyrinic acid a,c-diamide synthase
MTRGLMIAAPRSGSGKTTVTLGLLRAFRRRGVDVVGLKSGPITSIRPFMPRRRGARASTSILGHAAEAPGSARRPGGEDMRPRARGANHR